MEDTKPLESGHHGSSVTWEVPNGLPLEGAWNHYLTGTPWEMLVEESDNGQEGNFLFDGSFMFPMDFSDSTATLFHTGHTEKSFMWPSSPTINGVGSPAPLFSKSASSLATLFQAGSSYTLSLQLSLNQLCPGPTAQSLQLAQPAQTHWFRPILSACHSLTF